MAAAPAEAPPPWSVWIEAIRPKTLFAGVSPIVIGVVLAIDAGGFHLPSAAAALIAALAIQIAVNLHNDLADFESGADDAQRVGPRRVSQAGLLDRSALLRGIIVTFAIAGLAGIYAILRAGWPMMIILASSILAGLGYTGGPKPLGYIGLGDLFVLLFFGPVAVGGSYYLQTLTLTGEVLVAGLATGAMSTAILAINNLRDRNTDAAGGKRTLAVIFGERFARTEYLVLIAVGSLLPAIAVIAGRRSFFAAAPALTLIPAWPWLRSVATGLDGPALNPVLATTGRLTLLHALLFAAGILLAR